MNPFKGNLTEIFQQAQKMREEMQRIQEEMAKKTMEASVGGGMVRVTANGQQQIVSVVIDPEVLKMNDKEMLQDLVMAGVNQALKLSQDMMSEAVKKITGGLGPLASMLKV